MAQPNPQPAQPAPPNVHDELRRNIISGSSSQLSKLHNESVEIVRRALSTNPPGIVKLGGPDDYHRWRKSLLYVLKTLKIPYQYTFNYAQLADGEAHLANLQSVISPDLAAIIDPQTNATHVANIHESTIKLFASSQETLLVMTQLSMDESLVSLFDQEINDRIQLGIARGRINNANDNFFGVTGSFNNHSNTARTNLRFASRVSHVGTLQHTWNYFTVAPDMTMTANAMFEEMKAFRVDDTMSASQYVNLFSESVRDYNDVSPNPMTEQQSINLLYEQIGGWDTVATTNPEHRMWQDAARAHIGSSNLALGTLRALTGAIRRTEAIRPSKRAGRTALAAHQASAQRGGRSNRGGRGNPGRGNQGKGNNKQSGGRQGGQRGGGRGRGGARGRGRGGRGSQKKENDQSDDVIHANTRSHNGTDGANPRFSSRNPGFFKNKGKKQQAHAAESFDLEPVLGSDEIYYDRENDQYWAEVDEEKAEYHQGTTDILTNGRITDGNDHFYSAGLIRRAHASIAKTRSQRGQGAFSATSGPIIPQQNVEVFDLQLPLAEGDGYIHMALSEEEALEYESCEDEDEGSKAESEEFNFEPKATVSPTATPLQVAESLMPHVHRSVELGDEDHPLGVGFIAATIYSMTHAFSSTESGYGRCQQAHDVLIPVLWKFYYTYIVQTDDVNEMIRARGESDFSLAQLIPIKPTTLDNPTIPPNESRFYIEFPRITNEDPSEEDIIDFTAALDLFMYLVDGFLHTRAHTLPTGIAEEVDARFNYDRIALCCILLQFDIFDVDSSSWILDVSPQVASQLESSLPFVQDMEETARTRCAKVIGKRAEPSPQRIQAEIHNHFGHLMGINLNTDEMVGYELTAWNNSYSHAPLDYLEQQEKSRRKRKHDKEPEPTYEMDIENPTVYSTRHPPITIRSSAHFTTADGRISPIAVTGFHPFPKRGFDVVRGVVTARRISEQAESAECPSLPARKIELHVLQSIHSKTWNRRSLTPLVHAALKSHAEGQAGASITRGDRRRLCNQTSPHYEFSEVESTGTVLTAMMMHPVNTRARSGGMRRYLVDSGASDHFVPHAEVLRNLVELEAPIIVQTAAGQLHATHRGQLIIHVLDRNGEPLQMRMTAALVPQLHQSLISTRRLGIAGCETTFRGESCTVTMPNGRIVDATTSRNGNHYLVDIGPPIPGDSRGSSSGPPPPTPGPPPYGPPDDDDGSPSDHTVSMTSLEQLDPQEYPNHDNGSSQGQAQLAHGAVISMTTFELHCRLGHVLSQEACRQAVKSGSITGVYLTDTTIVNCQVCALVHMKRLPAPDKSIFGTSSLTIASPFSYIASDVKGPIVTQIGKKHAVVPDIVYGYKYFVTFICEKTSFIVVHGLRRKSDVPAAFEAFLKEIEVTGYKVRHFKSDNGGEYTGRAFKALCEEKHIVQSFTVPGTPSQNGKCERANQTLFKAIQALLLQSGRDMSLWYLALQHATMLKQITPGRGYKKSSPRALVQGFPVQGILPRLFNWGVDCVIYKDGAGLSHTGQLGVWVGVDITRNAALVYLPTSNSVKPVWHVKVYPTSPFSKKQERGNIPSGERRRQPPLLKSADDLTDANEVDQELRFVPTPIKYQFPSALKDTVEQQPKPTSQPHPQPILHGSLDRRVPVLTTHMPGQRTTNGLTDHERRVREDNFHELEVPFEAPPPRSEQTPYVEPQPTAASDERPGPTPVHTLMAPARNTNQRIVTARRVENAIRQGTRVSFINDPNLKSRGQSGRRWKDYYRATTISDALARGAERKDIAYDLRQNYLVIHDDQQAPPIGGTDDVGAPSSQPEHTTTTDESTLPTLTANQLIEIDFDHKVGVLCQHIVHSKSIPERVRATMLHKLVAFSIEQKTDNDTVDAESIAIPKNPAQAKSMPYCKEWLAAFVKEYQNFLDNDVFETVKREDIPKGAQILKGRWVGRVKTDAQGKISVFKMRWVVKGYTQKFTETFFEVNSPTPNPDTIRMLLSLAASTRMKLFHDDCTSAYLHATIDIEGGIFTEQPEGFEELDPDTGKPLLWRLKASVYGTRQAGRQWMDCLTRHLFDIGFTRLAYDSCAFYRMVDERQVMFLIVYVDDLLCLCTDTETHEGFLSDMRTRFQITGGKLEKFLGCTITETPNTISIDSRVTIEKLLKDFEFNSSCKPKSTPTPSGYKVDYSDEAEVLPNQGFRFQALMGYLSWLSTMDRPDLQATLTLMAGKAHKGLTQQDLNACNHLLKYLASTEELGITYHASESLLNKLVAFSDASYDSGSASAVGSYVVILNGGAISWRSFKIKKVCTSVAEAEVTALYEATRQVTLLRNLMKEFGFDQGQLSTPIFCDSQIAITACLTDKAAKKSNHYAVHVNYIKEALAAGKIHVKYCPTDKMLADILTKLTYKNAEAFTNNRNKLMGVERTHLYRELDQRRDPAEQQA